MVLTPSMMNKLRIIVAVTALLAAGRETFCTETRPWHEQALLTEMAPDELFSKERVPRPLPLLRRRGGGSTPLTRRRASGAT